MVNEIQNVKNIMYLFIIRNNLTQILKFEKRTKITYLDDEVRFLSF